MNDIAQQAHEIQAEITRRTLAAVHALDVLVPLATARLSPAIHDRLHTASTPAHELTTTPGALILLYHYGHLRIAVISRVEQDAIHAQYLTRHALEAARAEWNRSARLSAESLPWPLHPDYVRAHADQARREAQEQFPDNPAYAEDRYQAEVIRASVVRAVARHRENHQPWAAIAELRACTGAMAQGRLVSLGSLRKMRLLPQPDLNPKDNR